MSICKQWILTLQKYCLTIIAHLFYTVDTFEAVTQENSRIGFIKLFGAELGTWFDWPYGHIWGKILRGPFRSPSSLHTEKALGLVQVCRRWLGWLENMYSFIAILKAKTDLWILGAGRQHQKYWKVYYECLEINQLWGWCATIPKRYFQKRWFCLNEKLFKPRLSSRELNPGGYWCSCVYWYVL